MKQAPQAPVPQASAPQALAPSGLTTPPLSPFDTPSLTILLHRTADRLHTAYKDIEAELAKENAQNADLKQRVALLDEQVNAQQLDVELELHGAKEKIKYCQKRRAERVEELTLEIREWKERAEAAEREVEVLREKAGKWDALAADLAGEGVEGCGGE